MTRTVILVGATGLFGGHLAEALSQQTDIRLILAARSGDAIKKVSTSLGVEEHVLDRTDIDAAAAFFAQTEPFVVIDCSGPFQLYGDAPYAFAQTVIEAGAHYLDIADSAEFVAGIAALDELARKHQVCALSGLSTTPAISSAIVSDLTSGMTEIALIETAILPGNKTPRGLSVMRAILGQVGQTFSIRRAGGSRTVTGWSETRKFALSAGTFHLVPRPAAHVDTPDAALFPEYYSARSVNSRAGLELGLFHSSLRVLRFIVSHGPVRSLEPLSRLLLPVSRLFEGVGSDKGGMRVRVVGSDEDGLLERVWDLVIADGQGPKTPIQPVLVMLGKLDGTPSEARPALDLFDRAEIESQLTTIGAQFSARETALEPIFRAALGPDFETLPAPVQELHSVAYARAFEGYAEVGVAQSALGRFAARMIGFPHRPGKMPARVSIQAEGNIEHWSRQIGPHRFASKLQLDPITMQITEKFGPMSFPLGLNVSEGALRFPIEHGRIFGIVPIPKVLLPVSEASETIDDEGRFQFDVKLSLRSGALIVHYKGHLEPV